MARSSSGENKLFSVPSEKLVLMSVCTYGFYCWYWFFRNWSGVRDIRSKNFSPLVRTWLFPFYNFNLFEEIKNIARKNEIQVKWSSSVLSYGFILFLVGWYFPYTLFISIFVGVILVPANNTCEQINEAEGFDESTEGFDRNDWAIVIIGGLLVINSFFIAIEPLFKHPLNLPPFLKDLLQYLLPAQL